MSKSPGNGVGNRISRIRDRTSYGLVGFEDVAQAIRIPTRKSENRESDVVAPCSSDQRIGQGNRTNCAADQQVTNG